jgi:hypothetical protein
MRTGLRSCAIRGGGCKSPPMQALKVCCEVNLNAGFELGTSGPELSVLTMSQQALAVYLCQTRTAGVVDVSYVNIVT